MLNGRPSIPPLGSRNRGIPPTNPQKERNPSEKSSAVAERGRFPVELTLVLRRALPAHTCSPRGALASHAFVFRLNHQMATIDAGIPKTTRAHSKIRTMEPTT